MTETELAEFEARAELAESWGGEANLSALYDCCDAVPKLGAEVRRLWAIERRLQRIFGLSSADFQTWGWADFADRVEAAERDNDKLREQLGLKPVCWAAITPAPASEVKA